MESDKQEKTPASVTVFKNQTASVCLSADVDTPHHQNLETEALQVPNEAGENDELNITASLEDNNPPSDNQGEVIINIHALNNSLEVDSQPESQPTLSTDQHTEIVEPPAPLNDAGNEEQIIGIASELSISTDCEDRGSVNDAEDEESEGDRSDKPVLADETTNEPPVRKEEQVSSELLLSVDHDGIGNNISDIDYREESTSNNGQEREKSHDDGMINQSLGLPSEIDSSELLEPDDLAETTHDQYQIQHLLDTANKEINPETPENLQVSGTSDSAPTSTDGFVSSQQELTNSKDEKEACTNADSFNLPEGEIIINTCQDQLQGCVHETTVEDIDSGISLPSVQEGRADYIEVEELSEPSEETKVIESGENCSKSSKDDLEASAELELKCKVDHEDIGGHGETIQAKRGEWNVLNQSLNLLSILDNTTVRDEIDEDVKNPSHFETVSRDHTPVHLGSTNLQMTSSSAKSTSSQLDDRVLSNNPASTNESLCSLDDTCNFEEKDEAHSLTDIETFTEDTVSSNQGGEHNDTEAQTVVENAASMAAPVDLESQEEILVVSHSSKERYEEVAPIKCTFVGRTVKTVVRTLTEESNVATEINLQQNYESYTSSLPNTHHTTTEVSEENFTMPKLNEKMEEPHEEMESINEMKNGDLSLVCVTETFLTSSHDFEETNQSMRKIECTDVDVLQKSEQKFPYKYETVV